MRNDVSFFSFFLRACGCKFPDPLKIFLPAVGILFGTKNHAKITHPNGNCLLHTIVVPHPRYLFLVFLYQVAVLAGTNPFVYPRLEKIGRSFFLCFVILIIVLIRFFEKKNIYIPIHAIHPSIPPRVTRTNGKLFKRKNETSRRYVSLSIYIFYSVLSLFPLHCIQTHSPFDTPPSTFHPSFPPPCSSGTILYLKVRGQQKKAGVHPYPACRVYRSFATP